jgi:NAD(P)-dependent dehydrogenase (short-subunit alcohol dehydrogenase family)
MSKLASMVAIVTGSAAGIGRASAVRLAKDGASVVVADINPEGSDETVAIIESAGGTAMSVPTDLGEPEQILALIDRTVERFGTLDILHNNAADTSSQGVGRDKDLLTITSDLWDRTLAVNLRGPMLACRAAIPIMRRGGGGAIINTTSVSGMTGDLIYTAYGVSKAGLIVLTKYIATQYGKDGIRCNSISPGIIITKDSPDRATRDAENLAKYSANILVSDLGVPDDIAGVVAFLASSDARFITGENIRVDGGMESHIATLGHLRAELEPTLASGDLPF